MLSLQLRGIQIIFAPAPQEFRAIDIKLTTWFSIEAAQIGPALERFHSPVHRAIYRMIARVARIRGTQRQLTLASALRWIMG